jgi:hypothetical protein
MYENVCTIVDSDHIVSKRTRDQDNEPVLGALKRATWTSGHPRVSRPDDGTRSRWLACAACTGVSRPAHGRPVSPSAQTSQRRSRA